MVMMEEFGKANLVEPYLPSVVLSGCLISELATGEVKGEILEKLVGRSTACLAAAESGSRFNSAKVATTAESNGNNVVINGKKLLYSMGLMLTNCWSWPEKVVENRMLTVFLYFW